MAKQSFRQFDYRLRPNKSAERKMICEALQHLSFFDQVNNYQYIGFGATTFVDFVLFHKMLNITDMISIEVEEDYEPRVEFNKPYQCIQIKIGHSNEVIPQLSLKKKTILWLDYDGRLTDEVLKDIAYISAEVVSGSIMIITVHASPYQVNDPTAPYSEIKKTRIQCLRDDIGDDKVPPKIEGKQLEGLEMGKTLQRIIHNEIAEVLRDRNGILSDEHKMHYKQIFHFSYRDGARMISLGGVFYENRDKDRYTLCNFESLDYVRTGEEPYFINAPVITPREKNFLNKLLPLGTTDKALEIGLTKTEIENYKNLYRYYPDYAEIELP
jgi:hypothetical protein